MLTALSLQTLRYFKIGLSSIERRQRSVNIWHRIIAALENGDAEEMAHMMRLGMGESSEAIIGSIAREPV